MRAIDSIHESKPPSSPNVPLMPCLVFLPCYHTGFQAYLHRYPQERQSDRANCGWAVNSTVDRADMDI